MQLQQILALVTQINEKYNLILENAKNIDELEEQLELLANSYLPVRVGGVTQKLQVQKIIDAVQTFAVNEMVSVGTITVDGNDVTIPAGAQWRINGVNLFSSEPTVINIPFAATGKIRTDIIVANSGGNIVKVTGTETDTGEIAVRPPIPFNSVLVTQINVTDASFDTIVETIGEAPIDGNMYGRKDGAWEQILGAPGTTPTLPQVLAQGDRPIRYSDGDGDTILELDDREKFLYNRDADFLHLPAELYPDGTELKIYNAGEIDLFGITGAEYTTIIQINGIDIDELTPITLRPGTAILKKISGEPYNNEFWTLSYEVYDFSKDALGLNLVDNTPDNSKPVSTAQATAIANAQSAAQLYADTKKIKQPARFAVGTNVSSLSGSITVDSNLVTSDTILLLAQTDAKQNGLWVVNSGGAWTRPADFATAMDVSYSLIHVLAGTYKGKSYATGNGVVVGTNNINLSEATSSGETVSWMSQSSPRFLDNTTALQKIFNVGSSGNGSMAVTSGRKYRVKGWAVFSALTSTSKNVGFGILGTATASYVSGIGIGIISSAVSTPSLQALTSFSQTQLASNAAVSAGKIYIDFEFNCNGSGTFIPSVAFSLAQANMQVDSAYFDIVDIGASTAKATSNIV